MNNFLENLPIISHKVIRFLDEVTDTVQTVLIVVILFACFGFFLCMRDKQDEK